MAQEIDKIIKSKLQPKDKNVLWDNGKELLINRNGKWESTGGGAPMINITYANLVKLRNNSKLVAGMQYRITDYVTTTIQINTRSAGHQFDIIVTADDENTLNEAARACRSEFDIEKYKDAYSGSWGEKMLYIGTQEYEGKECRLYESESHDLQMLVDFSHPLKTHTAIDEIYPFVYYPSYTREFDGYDWSMWKDGREYSDVIQFKHEDPSYFDSCKLEAWQIWYSLDNDTERFAWAIKYDAIRVHNVAGDAFILYRRYKEADNGNKLAWAYIGEDVTFNSITEWDNIDVNDIVYTKKNVKVGNKVQVGSDEMEIESMLECKGVIYHMIDEWDNDCPYDFKNIQFKRNLNFDNGYAQFSEDGEETWVYTFAGQSYHINNDEYSGMLDGSLESPFGHMSDEGTSTFHDNVIKPYTMLYNGNDIRTECGTRYLNDNVFLGYWEKIGSANDEDVPYYYAYCCYSNSFENNCHSNSLGYGCKNNSFGNECFGNSFGYNCSNNTFGNGCYHNSFGNECSYNSFGNSCNFLELNGSTRNKTASVNSNGEVKMFNLADLADLFNS